jgi:cytochrome bd ubiquinol oxidase subunit II
VLVVIVVLAGAVILFPSLALLFALQLRGRFDSPQVDAATPLSAAVAASRRGLYARSAFAALLAGAGLIVFAETAWGEALGVLCLAAFVVVGFAAAKPAELAKLGDEEEDGGAAEL